ncbi:MAG: hypothetical protein WBQ94_03760 [Terracidiphilus sp.]
MKKISLVYLTIVFAVFGAMVQWYSAIPGPTVVIQQPGGVR